MSFPNDHAASASSTVSPCSLIALSHRVKKRKFDWPSSGWESCATHGIVSSMWMCSRSWSLNVRDCPSSACSVLPLDLCILALVSSSAGLIECCFLLFLSQHQWPLLSVVLPCQISECHTSYTSFIDELLVFSYIAAVFWDNSLNAHSGGTALCCASLPAVTKQLSTWLARCLSYMVGVCEIA